MFYYAGKNGNGDSLYIPSILKFSGYQPSQFSKIKQNITDNHQLQI